MKKPEVKVIVDRSEEVMDLLKKFKFDKVLVGIPEAKDKRRDPTTMNNASLFALANFGSPAQNIPAWPIMALGIKESKKAVADQFKEACINVLKDGRAAADVYYTRAGIIASTAIKKVLNSQTGKPAGRPLKSTLDARTKGGEKYWLVTGQIRNAITYVVKKGL